MIGKLDRMVLCRRNPWKGRSVRLKMVRRALIFVLGLSLAGLGQLPLSACAFFSSRLAECATPKTQSRCENMEMQESGIRLAASPDTSCCFTSNAPLSEQQYKASNLTLTVSTQTVPDPLDDIPRVRQLPPVLLVQNFSPPAFQSLLCTFLI